MTLIGVALPAHFHDVPSYLVKNTAEAHKEPNKKYKSNTEEQATSNSELNTSIIIRQALFPTPVGNNQ